MTYAPSYADQFTADRDDFPWHMLPLEPNGSIDYSRLVTRLSESFYEEMLEDEPFDWEQELLASTATDKPAPRVEAPPLEKWQSDLVEDHERQYVRSATRQRRDRSPKNRRRDGSVGRHNSVESWDNTAFVKPRDAVFNDDWDDAVQVDPTRTSTTPETDSPEAFGPFTTQSAEYEFSTRPACRLVEVNPDTNWVDPNTLFSGCDAMNHRVYGKDHSRR